MLNSENKNGPVIIVSKELSYVFPFGYAYLAGYLMEQGEKVKIMFRPEDPDKFSEFVDQIIAEKPLLVGLGTLYPDIYPVGEIIKLFKNKGCQFPIVIGGQMVTPTPEFATQITGADYGIIGEGEIILHELVKALRQDRFTENIKGLIVNDEGKLLNTGPGEYLKDMSKLPRIPYELFPTEKWRNIGQYYINIPQPHWRYGDKIADVHGGRGCPFRCNFCYHHSQPRYRSIKDMMADARLLIEKYDVNMLNLGDDLVIMSPDRARELVKEVAKLPKRIEYALSCRFDILDRIDDELLLAMKKSGLRNMGLGLESGSQRILDIIHKNITVEQIKKGLRRLKAVSVFPSVCIQIGQLTETNEDVQKSMDLMLETLRYDKNINYAFTITTPFPGTELYDIALEKGLLKDHRDFYNRFNTANRKLNTLTVNLSAMSDQEIKDWHARFQKTYSQEKKKLIGWNVWLVERLRIKLFRYYQKIDAFFSGRPALKALKKPANKLHDYGQLTLDWLRLYFLGVKKAEK